MIQYAEKDTAEDTAMNAILRKLRAILPKRTRPPRGGLSPRDIAMRYSRGNVNLQLGRIVFEDEYQKCRSRALRYEFS